MVKATINEAEIHLAMNRYTTSHLHPSAGKETPHTAQASSQASSQAPLKLKYPLPPLAPDLTRSINQLSIGFQHLAKTTKLSVQGIQMISMACRFSSLLDQPVDSEADEKHFFNGSTAASARLLDLYTDVLDFQRMTSFLLVSLPRDSANMRLERCLCLGLLQLCHANVLMPYSTQTMAHLVRDFCETICSITAKDEDEEACIVWLTLIVASEWKYCAAKACKTSSSERQHEDVKISCQIWTQKSVQIMDWLIRKYECTRTWEQMSEICSRFMWFRRLSSEWKQTWKEAMARRENSLRRKSGTIS